ncbi:hypothetical protein [Sphingomicrobium flavum]|uniref:hypothetical protein n=1 Tax=Sphingomicrobium flavum TaxID=1229164 RepID=UPI0021ADC668|nr:hypothetical protein [Sphingomicrobium flavum]
MLHEELQSIEDSQAIFLCDSAGMADLFFERLFWLDPSLRLIFDPRPPMRRTHFRSWLVLGLDALRAHAAGQQLPASLAEPCQRTALGPRDMMLIRHAFAHAVRLMLLPYSNHAAAELVIHAFDLLTPALVPQPDQLRSA